MEKVTEQTGPYRHLEQMTTQDLLSAMNTEDQRVARAIAASLPKVGPLVDAVAERMRRGGRLFYLGAGTSGRLGVLDASECPPTFGVSADWVIGVIAGGDHALRHPVEGAEDDTEQGFRDLEAYHIDELDTLVGIAASGTTPYVVGAVREARRRGILTGCITNNPGTPLAAAVEHPIEVVVGPEVVTGSTRMKAGTAQKLVLNMISTAVMIRLGRVLDNRMVDMQLSNQKLIERGTKMVAEALGVTSEVAKQKLLRHGSVRRAIAASEAGEE